MMMDNRGRVGILTSILRASSEDGGVPVIKVMYLSSLSYKHAKEYLTILTDHNLSNMIRGITLTRLIKGG
jgi:predicted transcriptional regulator